MKTIMLSSVLIALCGCSADQVIDQINEMPQEPVVTEVYEYFDYQYQDYTGRCRRLDDIAYCYPKVIADSDFTVTATIDFNTRELKVFDFTTWQLKFNDVVNVDMTPVDIESDVSVDGYWSPRLYFNEDYIELTYQSGELMGTTTQGCTVSGNTNGYTINLNLSGCAVEGDYQGLLTISGNRIDGMVSNGQYGAAVFYEFN